MFRRYFYQFIIIDKFHCLFQCETYRRCQQNVVILAGCANIGELLGFQGINHQVVITGMYAYYHAFIHFRAGFNQHLAAFLKIKQGITQCLAGTVGD